MASKPILFSTPMVQAILDDRKSMTRRVIKPQPLAGVRKSVFVKSGLEDGHGSEIKPKYQSGDILWVREAWANKATIDSFLTETNLYLYKADFDAKDVSWKWKPSIFMPREAARIFLRVTNVRVERIQEITAQDAKEEGIHEPYIASETGYETEMRGQFRDLWDSLNAKRGYGWESNPWVWVYEFERVSEDEIQSNDWV